MSILVNKNSSLTRYCIADYLDLISTFGEYTRRFHFIFYASFVLINIMIFLFAVSIIPSFFFW